MDYTPVRPDGEIERIVDEYASELFRLCLVMLKKIRTTPRTPCRTHC